MPLLQVPYVSQTSVTASRYRNDCGIACALMVAKYRYPDTNYTVDNLAKHTRLVTRDKGLTPADLIQLLKLLQVESHAQHSLSVDTLKNQIDFKKPVILLVNYKYFESKAFGHYVTLVGYDGDNMIVHDPYLRGPSYHMPIGTFQKATEDVNQFFYFKAQGVLLN